MPPENNDSYKVESSQVESEAEIPISEEGVVPTATQEPGEGAVEDTGISEPAGGSLEGLGEPQKAEDPLVVESEKLKVESEPKEQKKEEGAQGVGSTEYGVGGESDHSAPNEPIRGVGVVAGILALRDRAMEAIQFRKRRKLEKIMMMLGPTSPKATRDNFITNDKVEKLLHVSDATATRYLNQLVRENKLVKVGSGSGTVYKKN